MSFARSGTGAVELTDTNNYYPFGMNYLDANGGAFFGQGSYKNYKFQEQELQGTGFYAFKWRQYMPDLGRFFNVDPLATKYPYNSTYIFSENCVVVHRELEGLEKVYIFGGADLDGKGLSQTTKNIQSSVQQFSDKNKLGFEVKTYNSAPWSPAHGKAFMDIMSNHTEGEKIIIYGYSLGGGRSDSINQNVGFQRY